jgi:flagellar motor switch protein FliM
MTGGGARPAAQPVDLARLLGLAAMRAASEELALRLAVTDAAEDSVPDGALAGDLPDPGLLFRLDRDGVAGEAPLGLLTLCPDLVAAAVECQTTGAVRPRPAEPRRPTATDAAMAEAVAAATLAQFAALLCHLPDPPEVAGLTVGAPFPDPGAVALALREGAYRRWRLSFRIAEGRTGTLCLILAPAEAAGAGLPDPAWRAALGRSVMASPAALDAVLARLRLPLAEIGGLEAGQVLPLGAALDDLTLAAPGGEVVATGRLGRAGDRRAVRLRRLEGQASETRDTAAPKGEATPATAAAAQAAS